MEPPKIRPLDYNLNDFESLQRKEDVDVSHLSFLSHYLSCVLALLAFIRIPPLTTQTLRITNQGATMQMAWNILALREELWVFFQSCDKFEH